MGKILKKIVIPEDESIKINRTTEILREVLTAMEMEASNNFKYDLFETDRDDVSYVLRFTRTPETNCIELLHNDDPVLSISYKSWTPKVISEIELALIDRRLYLGEESELFLTSGAGITVATNLNKVLIRGRMLPDEDTIVFKTITYNLVVGPSKDDPHAFLIKAVNGDTVLDLVECYYLEDVVNYCTYYMVNRSFYEDPDTEDDEDSNDDEPQSVDVKSTSNDLTRLLTCDINSLVGEYTESIVVESIGSGQQVTLVLDVELDDINYNLLLGLMMGLSSKYNLRVVYDRILKDYNSDTVSFKLITRS